MSKLFITHSSQDDTFVRELQQALGDFKQGVWIDSRELRGGNLLWAKIEKAIEDASAYAVVVSPDALQSKWVAKELRHALEVQKQRGKEKYPVIPLSLDAAKLGVLEELFGEEPIYISVSSDAGGIDAALNAILVALGKRLPSDVPIAPQPKAEPLEELVLELIDLKFQEQDGVRRASARARLVYEPATPGQPEVASEDSWTFVAPLGPIEAEELRWYLEKYAIWPSEYFRDRARKVEESLVKWGQILYGAMPVVNAANVMNAWARIDGHADRRFSVHVDAALEAGAASPDVEIAREAATHLLGLQWELLHDGGGFLFQGANPTRVRRSLPNRKVVDVPVVNPPIRVLLVTARPEDEACEYIDHRASALPLVQAMEELGGLVRIQVLSPPTLTALRGELDRARKANEPHHIVHFDGHGFYDRRIALGGICFEDPRDISKLDKRRHKAVFTNELGPLLRDFRIPLVFLGACQTATADKASESVASELLKIGVASVVAMTHKVLVETARRFVEAFYVALVRGARVGDAMLEGQRKLKDDGFRGTVFGAAELHLEDWFVPVLFQKKDDPQLFRAVPASQTLEDIKTALAARFGELPAEPETSFIGRSRELLALERLLRYERYAVIRGQAGEGKTALAAEFGRWMVRSQQIRRAAFVSVETHSNVAAVLDALGRQLLPEYSVAMFENLKKAILPIERALAEQSTLLILDNFESLLLPPYVDTPEALSEEARRELDAILKVCQRLKATGNTRLVFTSREALPAPFDAERHRRELRQLDREDAVKLVERALNSDAGGADVVVNAAQESIEQLVDSVHCHARTLALLGPVLRSRGVDATRTSIVDLMTEMEKKFPGSREKSVFASVELSLQRMSSANRKRARVLGVFYGGFQMGTLGEMMHWEETEVASLADELIQTGLATRNRYKHLTLNPALCPYLRRELEDTELDALTARWAETTRIYAYFLAQQSNRDSELSAKLTMMELPNLFALLDRLQRLGDAEAAINLIVSLFRVLQFAGRPRLLERLAEVRDASAAGLGVTWSHALFEAQRIRIEQQHMTGDLREALNGAEELLAQARIQGEDESPKADFDLAHACLQMGSVLATTGRSEQALPFLNEALDRFEHIAASRGSEAVAVMATRCFSERAACLVRLGRLDEADVSNAEGIRRDEQRGDQRGIATGKIQKGEIRSAQRQYSEALAAYSEALEHFERFEELGSMATIWNRIGLVYHNLGHPEEAEDAYQKSLVITVRIGDVHGQANTLSALGNLYDYHLNRLEEAVVFHKQVVDKYLEIADKMGEANAREDLGCILRKLQRFDDARREIRLAIEGKGQFGHTAQPWASWTVLADIETAAGNPVAASEAMRQATVCYLDYRRDGGENHYTDGRICFAVTPSLLAGDLKAAASVLQSFAENPTTPNPARPFIQALQDIIAGNRDPSLADAPDLNMTMAAEILFLLENLEKSR
jgi:tetratricopeptide (TPR) repeat protein